MVLVPFATKSNIHKQWHKHHVHTALREIAHATNVSIEIRKCVVLFKSPDKDWDVEKEMKGWGLGEWPCLPSCDNDWDDDISDA